MTRTELTEKIALLKRLKKLTWRERQPDQKGDRVRVSMSGKLLPYKQY